MIGCMTDETKPSAQVLAFRLTPKEAEKRIRKIALISGRVTVSDDASLEMRRRDTTYAQCLEVLRAGNVDGDPIQTATGEWQCIMRRPLKDGRILGVVVVLRAKETLFVRETELAGRL